MPSYNRLTLFLVCVVVAVLIGSGIGPKDRMTWWLEVAPVLIGLAVLLGIRRRFRFTDGRHGISGGRLHAVPMPALRAAHVENIRRNLRFV